MTLQIEKANVDTIKTLIASFSDTDDNVTSESNESTTSGLFGFSVSVDHASLSLDPFVEQNISVYRAQLGVKDAEFANNSVSIRALDLQIDSNVTDMVFNAHVKNNHLRGKVRFAPTEEFLALYGLPFRKEAINDIIIDIRVTQERVEAVFSTKIHQLLKGNADAFNVDIDSLRTDVDYLIGDGIMKANTKVLLSTPYAKDVLITNLFTMDDNISYSGEINVKEIIGVDAKFVKPLNNLQIKYEGDITKY